MPYTGVTTIGSTTVEYVNQYLFFEEYFTILKPFTIVITRHILFATLASFSSFHFLEIYF